MNTQDMKRHIRAHLAYWVPMLGLAGWSVTILWHRPEGVGRNRVAAVCLPQRCNAGIGRGAVVLRTANCVSG